MPRGVNAVEQGTISSPLITSVQEELDHNQIWHIGGAVSTPGAEVIIYLQNEYGNTLSFTVKANNYGNWVHSHDAFLKAGSYKSWAQLKVGGELSPPSPEVSFEVVHTALSVGAFRISYSTIYLVVATILLLVLVALGVFGFRHLKREKMRR